MIDPLARLLEERRRAAENNDPVAGLCWAANVDAGEAQVRTLVLRELDGRLALFLNALSPKWHSWQAQTLPLALYLPTLSLQYRLRCRVEAIDAGTVHASWQQRPPVPKQLDWLYPRRPQSGAIESRQQLIDELSELGFPEVAPEHAAGLYLHPFEIDRLDLGTDNGVHDRRLYRLQDPHDAGPQGVRNWSETVLVP